MTFLQRIRELAIDTIYPKTCAGCGLRGTWVCDICEPQVMALSRLPGCERCGMPHASRACRCRNMHPNIHHARSCFPYTLWVANAVRQLKYHDESSRAEHLAEFLKGTVADLGNADGLVPVPLHARKLRDRGYNQSQLLAERVGSALNIPVVPLVMRHRATISQVGLRGDERRTNVADAFSIDDRYVPRPESRYIIIDDVRTTGSTLNACATALAGAGITHVDVVTFALDMLPAELELLRDSRKAGYRSSRI